MHIKNLKIYCPFGEPGSLHFMVKNWGEMNLKPGSFLAWLGLSNAIPREWLKFLKHPELHLIIVRQEMMSIIYTELQ